MRKIYQLHTADTRLHPNFKDLTAKVAGETLARLQREVQEHFLHDELILRDWETEGGWTYMQTYIVGGGSYVWYVITRLTILEEGD